MALANQSDFLVLIDGIDGTWATATGAETTSEARKYRDGGSDDVEVTTAKPDTSNLVVTRGYRAERDAGLYKRLVAQVGRYRTTASRYDIVRGVAAGDPVVLEVVLIGVTPPEMDANSAETGRLQTTWAVGSVK